MFHESLNVAYLSNFIHGQPESVIISSKNNQKIKMFLNSFNIADTMSNKGSQLGAFCS